MWTRGILVFIISVLQCRGETRQLYCPGRDNLQKEVCLARKECLSEMKNFTWEIKPGNGLVTVLFKSLCSGIYKFKLETLDNSEETLDNSEETLDNSEETLDNSEETLDNSEESKCNGSEHGNATLSNSTGYSLEWFTYSSREVHVTVKNDTDVKGNYTPCEQVVSIHFNMVYSGCYRLKVLKLYNYVSMPTVVSKPRFLSTNLTEEEILKMNYTDPIVISNYDADKDSFQHRVIGLQSTHASEIYLDVLTCNVNQTCNHCRTAHSLFMMLNGNEDFVCKSGENNRSSCFAVGRNEIQCDTKNIANKSQCFEIRITKYPCIEESKIGKKHSCDTIKIQSKPANLLQEKAKTAYSIETDNKDFIVLLLVTLCLVAACICVLFFVLRRVVRRWWIDGEVEPEEKYKPAIAPDILLLYSRDCEKFMQLMGTFRKLLRKALNCKVHDCFDPHLAERLSLGSVEWLNSHIDNKNVKVVVVESVCAVLHYRYLNKAYKIEYRDPSCLDGLFLHALQRLKNDSRKNRYDTVFVVQIDGFSSAGDTLTSLTSQARYTLPLYLSVLFNVLYREPDIDCTEEKEAFKRDIEDLKKYKENNKDYLTSLLVEVKDQQAHETRLNIFKYRYQPIYQSIV